MPHRTTYFFPRQFPGECGPIENPITPTPTDHENKSPEKHESDLKPYSTIVSDCITSGDEKTNFKLQGNQSLASLYNWLTNKKISADKSIHVKSKLWDDERQLLISTEPEPVAPQPPPPPLELFSSDDTRKDVNENEYDEGGGEDNLAQKAKESYYLQVTLAKRLSFQASLASEPSMLLLEAGAFQGHDLSSDAETVSYRLWVEFDPRF